MAKHSPWRAARRVLLGDDDDWATSRLNLITSFRLGSGPHRVRTCRRVGVQPERAVSQSTPPHSSRSTTTACLRACPVGMLAEAVVSRLIARATIIKAPGVEEAHGQALVGVGTPGRPTCGPATLSGLQVGSRMMPCPSSSCPLGCAGK